jgi:hypothetical protein
MLCGQFVARSRCSGQAEFNEQAQALALPTSGIDV